MQAIGTALSGIQASIARLNASANNIANANSNGPLATAGTPSTASSPQVYQPVRISSASLESGGTYTRVVPHTPGFRPVSDPTSPYANAAGMVAAPEVDFVSEMVEQIAAKLAFSANLSVVRTADEMQGRLVDRWA
ncbi:MAG: flagellar basal body rod protein FlgC [Sphingobium sp.]